MRRTKHVRVFWRLVPLVVMGFALTGCALLDLLPELPPATPPTGVTASVGQFADRIRVTWTAVEGATTYRVWRADARDGDYIRVGEVAIPSFDDVVVEQGRLYWYVVEACNAAGCGPRSSPVAGYAGFPPAPTNVQASEDRRDKIVITWDAVPGAARYRVYREVAPGVGFRMVGEVITATSFHDTGARLQTPYWYRVDACNAHGCSALSEPDEGRRPF